MKSQKEDTDYVFTLEIRNDHFIIRDHKVHGVGIIPGVTYLDLILRYSKKVFDQEFALHKVVFIEPLSTDMAYNRMLEVRFRKKPQGYQEAMVRSQRVSSMNGEHFGPWSQHMLRSSVASWPFVSNKEVINPE